MKFPIPNHCGLTWDALNQLVARKLAEDTIVGDAGDAGDGWLVAYLEGHWFDHQPDDLIVYYSYTQDFSDWSIGNEPWTNLGCPPNTPRDHHWYEALPHPKQFTDRNSSRVDGIILAYSDRGKRYHYAEVEIAAARKLKPLNDRHERLECYDIIVLKTAAGTASLRSKVAEVITERLTVTNINVVVTQAKEQVELFVLNQNSLASRSFSQTISLANLTQKALEEAIAALDRQVQAYHSHRQNSATRSGR